MKIKNDTMLIPYVKYVFSYNLNDDYQSIVATTIEITTTIEIIISIAVENAFQTKHHIATTIEITTTIEIIISIVVENAFQT